MKDFPPPAPEFDAVGIAKELLRSVRAGALATIDRAGGFPFASLVTVATDHDGSPLLLMSRLSAHTLNLEQDPRASVLLAKGGKGDPLADPRLTVIGRAARTADDHVRRRFLARHPKAQLYAGFGDFSFWRLDIAAAHLNGGFARAMDLAAAEVRTALGGGGARRHRSERGRAYERRSPRGSGALCDEARRRSDGRVARDRSRSGRHRSRRRRS